MPCQGLPRRPARRPGPAEGREGSKLPADDGVMLRRALQADGQANASEGKRARHASDPLLLFRSGLAVLSLGEAKSPTRPSDDDRSRNMTRQDYHVLGLSVPEIKYLLLMISILYGR